MQRERELQESMRKKEEDEKRLRDQEDQIVKAEELQAAENKEKERIALRLELEQQIAEQRSREWEAVLARDHELLLMMKHDRDNEVNFEQRLWQEERIKRVELKQLKHRNLCYEVLLQIVGLAESSAMYTASTNCNLSSIDWWELKNLFVKGAIHPVNLTTNSSAMDVLLMEDDKIADEAAVMDYINEQGEWESLPPIGTNKELRNIVASLFLTKEADSSPVPPSFLSHMQLKLAVIGIPFAGKTFVAKLLEDRFGIARIDVEKILASAIADAQREEELAENQQKDDQASSIDNPNKKTSNEVTSIAPQGKTASEGTQSQTVPSRLALGRQARTAVANGLQVPDDVTVQLLLHALESLDDTVSETQSISPKDTKKKDSPLKEPSPRLKDNSDVHPPSQTSLTPPASHRKIAKEKAPPSREGQHMKKRTTGFILDGFPSTQQQAALLQKGLSGLKLSLESETTAYASVLAPPPDSDLIVTKLPYPLDALFGLDPLEEGDAFKQAMGKYIDPKTGLLYHLEFEPPPANDRTGIASRLKPIEDVTAAGKRIKEGLPIWNLLYNWITTFSNVHLICHDERKRLNLEETYTTIQSLLDAKLKVSAAADAAKAAAEAEDAATSAACEAEKASSQAKAIAQKLFLSKLAEVEALTLLERPSNDPAPKDILKKKVSESTSRILQEVAKSVKDAEASADAAKKAAEDAFQAKQTADEAVLSVSAVVQAKEEALAAAELAKVSASKAAVASQRAQLAAENASLNLADANNCSDNLDKSFLKQKISDLSTQPIQEEVEKPLVVETVTQSSQAEQSCVEHLCKQWQEIEGTYLSKLKDFFVQLRKERNESHISLKKIKGTFASLLKNQDERQACLDDFQGKYNRVDALQRSTVKMKKQLQKKAEDFFQKLYTIFEEFLKEAEVVREKSLSTWTKQRMEAISQCFIMLVQIEMERFLQTCCLLHEYFLKETSSHIKDKFSDGSNFPSPRSKQGKNLSMLPGWLPSITDAFPQLHQVLQQNILMADAIMKSTFISQSANPNQTAVGHKIASRSAKGAIESTVNTQVLDTDKNNLLAKVLHDELQLLLLRFQRLVSKACSHVADLETLLEGAKTHMEKWIQDSRQAKSEAIEEVVNIIQEAIEESIPLWYYMCLDGDGFAIDETKLQLGPPQALGLHPLPNLASYHCRVIDELVKKFKEECPKGYVSLMKAMEELQSAIQSVHFICKNDLTLSMVPRVPGTKSRPGGPFEVWKDHAKEIVSISSLDTQLIDWRCFLVSIINAHYQNFISSASVNDLLQAHSALKEAADGCNSIIDLPQFLSTKLWFDSDDGDHSEECIKRIFFNMLSLENGMPWQSFLLYLCKDSDTEIALRKAQAAIKGIQSDSVTLTSQELLQAVYPCGMEGALDQGCQTWSFHDLKKLAEKLQAKSGQEAEINERTSRAEELDDNFTGSDALYARSTGACMGSKSSEQSLVSFQLMPYELDEGAGGMASSISSEVASMSTAEKRASKEAESAKGTSKIHSSHIDNNEDRQDDGESACSQLEVCSLFSEQAVSTMNEFLMACNEALRGSRNAEKGGALPDEGVGEMVFCVKDLLASELSAALQARFGTNTLLAMAPTPLAGP